MEKVDLGKLDKLQLETPLERQIYSDLMTNVESELKDTFLLAVLAENFTSVGKQRKLKNIMDRFFNEIYELQIKAMDEMYNKLTDEQKQKEIPIDRYKDIFTFTLRSVQMKYEAQLNLNRPIIIN